MTHFTSYNLNYTNDIHNTRCNVDLAPTFGFDPFRPTSGRLGRREHAGESNSIQLFHF
jgi:hypothetical protein